MNSVVEETVSAAEETKTEDADPVINVDIVGVTDTKEDDVFAEQKEAFMKACENMFDALAAKFKKEMADRK